MMGTGRSMAAGGRGSHSGQFGVNFRVPEMMYYIVCIPAWHGKPYFTVAQCCAYYASTGAPHCVTHSKGHHGAALPPLIDTLTRIGWLHSTAGLA